MSVPKLKPGTGRPPKHRPERPYARTPTKALHAHLGELAHALTVVLLDSTAREREIDNRWILWAMATIRAELDHRDCRVIDAVDSSSPIPAVSAPSPPLSTLSTV